MAGYGGKPGNGPGWGGPAKGFVSKPPRAFDGTEPAFANVRASDMNHDPETQAAREAGRSKTRLRREQHDKHLDRLNEIALGMAVGTAQDLNVSIAAAREFADRVVGKPIQTNINANVRRTPAEFTDEELLALARAGMGAEGDDEAGDRQE